MTRPNLFSYATKELSQDAVICWLLEWAGKPTGGGDVASKELRRCGLRLLRALLPDVKLGSEVDVRVHHQVKRIDVLAHVNQQHVLLIEDKTNSNEHSNQLKRYYKEVRDGGLLKQAKIPATAKEHLHAVCIKTGNLSRAERIRIEDQDFAVFDRKALLRVLNLYSGQNDILVDFRRHLKRWERETNSFQKWSRNEKKPERLERGWEGLYAWIEDHYQDKSDEKWGYLRSTLIGGFHGLWVEPTVTSKNSRFAMWIERDRISFRLYGAKRQESLKGMDREKLVWASRSRSGGDGWSSAPTTGLIWTDQWQTSIEQKRY
ncbi:MAG: hypothetical protein F4053_10315 [Proteobacteria bacterium]|nr:hypothetical protein [Pseudomonadota bacterium]